jgi:hypothetical protein
VQCLDDPSRLVRRWLECADQEQLFRDLIDRDDRGHAADRLRQVLAERQEAWLQGATWLAQLQASRGSAADEEVLWQLVQRWAQRADLEHLGEQGSVWRTMSGQLAVSLALRGGDAE